MAAGRKLENQFAREQLLDALANGCSRTAAAARAGLDRRTVYNECKRDPEFNIEVIKAEGSFLVGQEKIIANSQDWRAVAWWLERRYPNLYARRDPDVLTRDQMSLMLGQVIALVSKLSSPEALTVVEGMRRISASLRAENNEPFRSKKFASEY